MTARRSLIAVVAWRVLAFGLIAMALQVALVFHDYWSDDETLARRLIELETGEIAAGLALSPDGHPVFSLPAPLAARYGAPEPASADATSPRPGGEAESDPDGPDEIADGYYLRVRTRDGTVLHSNCSEDCVEHFLPLTINPPSFWQREIGAGKPLTVAGGRSFSVGGTLVAVEIAVVRDPDGRIWTVLGEEMVEHMLVPMALQLSLVFGATLWSVQRALAPVRQAVVAADALDPRDAGAHLDTTGMPAEIARLADAVNRALDRVRELVRGQKLFASAIAHEIRTPAAIVRMELERIDHPRAVKALGDLTRMTHVLEQLTALARLDTVDESAFRAVDLATIAADTVALLAPAAFDAGQTIAFTEGVTGEVRAVPSLVETLIRNLVDNAIRHTPAGTAITVEVGPGPVLTVADDGPGIEAAAAGETEGGAPRKSDGLGIGRRIVARIAEIHGARIETVSEPAAGTRVSVVFPAADAAVRS